MPQGNTQQLPLGIEFAPQIVRRHGLQDAHIYPRVSGRKGWAIRVPAELAWAYKYLELNPANSISVLALDCDDPEGLIDAIPNFGGPGFVADPNWLVGNTTTGHCHVVWCLATPVHRNRESSTRPMALLSRVAEYYTGAAGADQAYNGVLSRNPFRRRGGKTYWRRREPYTLRELASYIPRAYRAPPTPQTWIGRNHGLFTSGMKFAGDSRIGGCLSSVPCWSGIGTLAIRWSCPKLRPSPDPWRGIGRDGSNATASTIRDGSPSNGLGVG